MHEDSDGQIYGQREMKYRKLFSIGNIILVVSLVFPQLPQAQQTTAINDQPILEDEILERDLVSYPVSFFDRFQPITALDIVNQVPGFQLEGGFNNNRVRGFANTPGNVLIDDRRPSAKRDSLGDILTRIPVASIERIELIRGQVRGIDLRGDSAVVNIILREGIPASVQWETGIRQTFGFGGVTPSGRISLTDNWKGIDYNVGIRGRRNSVGRIGTEDIFDPAGNVIESRLNDRNNRNTFITTNLNASAWWGESFIQVNTNYTHGKRRTFTDSVRTDELTNIREDIFFDNVETQPNYEFSLDIERLLFSNFQMKGIFLYVKGDEESSDIQRDTQSTGQQSLFREAISTRGSNEVIGRLEFDWSGFSNHAIQANLERAYNVLDSTLEQTDDTGSGSVIVDVPGANSRVEEIRWDFLLKDTWLLGQFELNYGLGAEASTIAQTGDTELTRDFFFLKPQAILTYSSVNSDQTRLQIVRDIAQLDLEDFVSATEFLDDDVALGNPNIKPDATWKLEISQEKRFGGDAVVKLTAFHNWISNVLDLLPLSPTFEATGNIGDGRRWGLQLESTVPMDWMGLAAAKLDIKLRWQDSTVVDPVTGENRMLSVGFVSGGPVFFNIENKYGIEIDYRQDFQDQKIAWGWHIGERAKQLRFKVNELEIYNEGMEFRTFVETTRWAGIKIRISGENLLDFADIRDRRIFSGERDLTSLESRQFRDQTRGIRLSLSLSGNF
ncbi:MAG: hypothetical protein ACI9XC_000384 [Gammaproteobacteria bacterium]|jgi:hypothetical protein